MEKTKVISVRLSTQLLEDLDKKIIEARYWKRNAVIEKALESLVYATDWRTFQEILNWWPKGNKQAKLTFDLNPPKPIKDNNSGR